MSESRYLAVDPASMCWGKGKTEIEAFRNLCRERGSQRKTYTLLEYAPHDGMEWNETEAEPDENQADVWMDAHGFIVWTRCERVRRTWVERGKIVKST